MSLAADEQRPPSGRPERHVAMLVRNPYSHDSRVEKEAASLVEAGYRVTVIADAAPGLPTLEDRGGARVIRVARRGPRIPGLSFLAHEARLARTLRRLRPDILHAHDSNALIPVGLAAAMLGVPYLYDAHDLWLHRPRRQRSTIYHAAQNAWYSLVERVFVPRAAAVLTVSPPIADHLRARYRLPSVDLVPNYPDLHELDGTVRELRERPGMESVPPAAPLVLYLGGLMGGRGIEQLVDAMTLMDDAHLVLLGAGHLADDLAERARSAGIGERIHLLDPVPPAEVVGYAASATIGVSPIVPSCLNYRYSLPNKLFQYMAAGIPVVASDFPQVREIVEGAGAGRVVDTERPEAIARAAAAVLADSSAAAEMGRRGREAVRTRYHWGTSADALLAAYARIA